MKPHPALLALALAAPALAAPKPLPSATPIGPAVDCIQLGTGLESKVRDDRTIDFFRGRQAWRNTLPYACPSLGFERAFSYETSLTRLCSVDIIRVYRNSGGYAGPGASCGLGKFQPVKGLKR